MAQRPFTEVTPALLQAMQAFSQNDHLRAIHLCDTCLQANLHDVNAWHLKGRCLTAGGLYDLARKHLKNALVLKPNDPSILVSLGRLEIELGNAEAALTALNQALRQQPDFAEASLEKGKLLERMGAYEPARKCFENIDPTSPFRADAEYSLAQLHFHAGTFSEAVEQAEKLMARTDNQSTVYRKTAFVQGRALDKLKKYDQAMAAWKKGNANFQTNFDPSEYASRIDAYMRIYGKETFQYLHRSSCQSMSPVFIVGMPRSGTTLVEQILGAHNQVLSAGELRHIEILAQSLPDLIQSKSSMPECMTGIQADLLDQVASRHLKELDDLNQDQCLRVVNKSLENYWFVGLLHQMYPMAKFIFVRRNPFDNALSVFSNWFNPHKYSYTYTTELKSIGFVYRQVERLMRHWTKLLPEHILHVEYEALLEDPEQESRKMVDHLGLEWDPNCLQFHKSDRLVLTLSYAQVNRPIYRSSQDRWKPYEKHLGELEEALRHHDR